MICIAATAQVGGYSWSKATQAFTDLFQSPELRRRMGSAGQLHATQEYDWKSIIPRYESLGRPEDNATRRSKI